MTIRDLAAVIHCTKDTISRSLGGAETPTWEFTKNLVEAVGPRDARSQAILLNKAKTLWQQARTTRSTVETIQHAMTPFAVKALHEAADFLSARSVEIRSTIRTCNDAGQLLAFILGAMTVAVSQLTDERDELRHQLNRERQARARSSMAAEFLEDAQVRLSAAEQRRDRTEEQLMEANRLLGQAYELNNHLIAKHTNLVAELLRLSGGVLSTEDLLTQADTLTVSTPLFGPVDQDASDTILNSTGERLAESMRSLSQLANQLGPQFIPEVPLDFAEHGRLRQNAGFRLFSVLREIALDPIDCVAALVDNGLRRRWSPDSPLLIELTTWEGGVSIADDGQPLDVTYWLTDLGNSSDPPGDPRHDKSVSASGMSVLIAIARLGTHLTVESTAHQTNRSLTATLDMRRMQSSESVLDATDVRSSSAESQPGNRIAIRHEPGSLNMAPLKPRLLARWLGDTFSYLLRYGGLQIVVDGEPVLARMPCAWSETRSVERGSELIPAVMNIDIQLSPTHFCGTCSAIYDSDVLSCEYCQGRVRPRSNRVWGWLGIQRYLDRNDFGIDFLSHGRKILRRDKSLFVWNSSDLQEIEYPIDSPRNEGRIIGEIHCDFVPLNYQKNHFDYGSRYWKELVEGLRGVGPLRPQFAKKYGYQPNESPLARLFFGYRRTEPGLRCLIPGDGVKSLDLTSWVDRFRAGDPDLQSDQRWFEAASQHDHPSRRSISGPDKATRREGEVR